MSDKKANRTSKPHESQASPPNDTTKSSLMAAGTHLFARQGYDGTTVKDISERAGVNVSLVSYHFQGKEGLYRACMEQFGRSRLSIAERVLQPAGSSQECRIRLQMFIEEMFSWYLDEPDLNRMLQREIDSGLPVAEDVFRATFLRVFETLEIFIKKAQEKKFLKSGFDTQIGAGLIFGSLNFLMRMNEVGSKFTGISIKDPKHRRRLLDQIVPIFFDGMESSPSEDTRSK